MVAGSLPEDYLPGLRPLIEAGLKENPDMIVRQLGLAVAGAQRIQSGLAPLLPHFGSNIYYGEYQSFVSGNSGANNRNKGFFGGVNVSQNIFQWGALKNQMEIARAGERMAQKNYAEGYRTFVFTLRRQYLALIIAKMNLRNARFALGVSRKVLAVATEKLSHGAIAAAEIGGPQLDVERGELAVDRSEQAYVSARQSLAAQVGRADIDDASIPMDVPDPRFDAAAASALLAELLRQGAIDTYQAEAAELNVRQWDLRYRIARVRLLPQVFASATVSQQNQQNATATSVYQTALLTETFSIGANWNLFDGLATRGAKLEALSNKRIAERQLKSTADAIMRQAQDARRNLDFAWKALHIAQVEWASASGSYDHTMNEGKRGNVSQDAIDSAQNGLYGYETNRAASRADFLSAWSEFVSLVGADPAMNRLPARYVRPNLQK